MTKPNTLEKVLARKKISSSNCWLWQGAKDTGGYGMVKWHGKLKIVHRLIWELYFGDLRDTLTLDHLCRVRECFNPDHLEPTSLKENVLRGTGPTAINARKTHCSKGHKLTKDNLRRSLFERKGIRQCRTCRNTNKRLAYQKAKQA